MRNARPGTVLFSAAALGVVGLLLGVLGWLVYSVCAEGVGRLDLGFLTSFPSRRPAKAGVLPAVVGSVLVVAGAIGTAGPLGVATALYLEEYRPPSRVGRLLEANISNLAAVPSIVYGILGLGIFVRTAGLGRSVLSGSLTLGLLVLPTVVVSSREAVRSVPRHLSDACLALGATQWQTLLYVVLPAAAPGILTGVIAATSRALGETAPLVVVGALAYASFLPTGPFSEFTVLPVQIFGWISRPGDSFRPNAAAAIVVLLSSAVLLNGWAVWYRHRTSSRNTT